MMSIHTKFLEGKNSIVFIGLNATTEAVKVGSVFCTKPNFWKILKGAGLIDDFKANNSLDYPYQHLAEEVFINGNICKIPGGMGFTDIIDDNKIDSKKSSQVKVLEKHLESLNERLKIAQPEKIVLLGKRVSNEFMRLDNSLKYVWDEKKKKDNKTVYDFLGQTSFFGKKIHVYVMPFPETSPVEYKEEYFKKLI